MNFGNKEVNRIRYLFSDNDLYSKSEIIINENTLRNSLRNSMQQKGNSLLMNMTHLKLRFLGATVLGEKIAAPISGQ